MANYTLIQTMHNTGTDGSPVWAAVQFGGTAGANEFRFCASGAGSSVASASWPMFARPGSTAIVDELWGFTADGTGVKNGVYDGTPLVGANVLAIDFDNLGSMAAPPVLTAYGDTTHVNPVANAQPGAFTGSPIVNGSADTSGTSYLKINLYGTSQVANPSSGACGSTCLVTSGTAGSVSPGAGAWLATWQSAMGTTQYITAAATPAITTAGKLFFNMVLFTGPTMSLGTISPCVTFSYSYV